MNNIKVICCVLILAVLVTWCNGRVTMQDLRDADLDYETRDIARELLKRFSNKRCISPGNQCSASRDCCGTSNAEGACACNAGTNDCHCTYGGEFLTDSGGPVSNSRRYQRK
ncbi:unnamed protein product [Adineta steineri]|uniref:Uncharacterized protein n=1 Tax=Adineta steineri TaxID=433720 RepID=A0A819E8C7_9BILA|nr:unnamed protein product [Adineta steineri]CAF3846388.1 unnamed protein product [Adineta steineri]